MNYHTKIVENTLSPSIPTNGAETCFVLMVLVGICKTTNSLDCVIYLTTKLQLRVDV